MARKSRTPAPPRKVQAPQRRAEPKRPRPWSGNRWLLLAGVVLAAAIAAVVAVVLVTRGGSSSAAPQVPDERQLIGLQTGPPPWNPGLDTLPDRLEPLGLTPDTNGHAGLVLHNHAHLDIFVNGKRQLVPANIGIYDGQFLTDLHTHDASGTIHVESPKAATFTLGQFFGVWGVRFDGSCIGGFCRQVTPWTVYVNGRAYDGDPAAIVLRQHQEIAVVIGSPPKKVPSSYRFPAGE